MTEPASARAGRWGAILLCGAALVAAPALAFEAAPATAPPPAPAVSAPGPLAPVPAASPTERIVIDKAQRRLRLYQGDTLLKTYVISLGPHPDGTKTRRGDGRTPEGEYIVDARNARSAFHRSLHLSYPNAADRARAAALGVDPGGGIAIHGIRNGLGKLAPTDRRSDWTQGCIAVSDAEIEELWRLVPLGTPVEIRP